MIERYTRPAMGKFFSDGYRFATWLRVELAHLETLEEFNVAPAGTADAVRRGARVDLDRIAALEETLHHDVVAFLTSIGEGLGPEKGWIHFGMTSSDLVDTAQALVLTEALGMISEGWEGIGRILRGLAEEHRALPCVGRTHGVHAEPTTFGFKALGWFAEAERQARRLEEARETIRFGKLSGAVGTAVHLEPRIEESVMARLGLQPEPAATQVVPRDRHAAMLAAIAGCGATLERIATEIRHLQRTEVREAEEPFGKGQKGSSSMPHKRNPILCERVSGLARLLRAYSLTGFENIALWHERDISHSSTERVIFPDACILLDYMIDRMRFVLSDLVVRPDAMRKNLDATGGLVFSQGVLLALTEALHDREKAYRIVQTHAMDAWAGGASFRDRILGDPDVTRSVMPEELEMLFDPTLFARNLEPIFQRVLATDWGRS